MAIAHVGRKIAFRIASAVRELGLQDPRGAGAEEDGDAFATVFVLCP
jgi:hypothetical protein